MKNFTIFTTALVLSVFLFFTNSSNAHPGSGFKSIELNTQIIDEIEVALQNPYIKYETKDLTGEVEITTTVNEEGRIIFGDICGINENLTENVIAKLNSLNLWTSSDYSGIVFLYKLNYKN